MIENKIICKYCSKEMNQGSSHFGAGINTISYWCECGSVALFARHFNKKIKSIDTKYEYEEEEQKI